MRPLRGRDVGRRNAAGSRIPQGAREGRGWDAGARGDGGINQDLLIKRDTVVMYGSQRYHCYVQVNPTTYKVIKRTYNDEGVAVDNIYHDNIINLAVYHGASKVFSSDFHKQDFKKYLTEEILKQSVLSDMIYNRLDEEGIHYDAFIGIPDSPSGYVVDVLVGYDGKVKFEMYK